MRVSRRFTQLIAFPVAFVAGTSLAASPALAGQRTTTFDSRLVIKTGCIMAVGGMDFGLVKVITPTIDTTADINVRCTANTPFQLTIDQGQNAVLGVRHMRADKFPARTHPYLIYTNAARTQLWTPTTVVSRNSGSAGLVTVTAYGRVQGVAMIFPSPYRDTVTVTLTF
jgi:spore coat protein U-like protein